MSVYSAIQFCVGETPPKITSHDNNSPISGRHVIHVTAEQDNAHVTFSADGDEQKRSLIGVLQAMLDEVASTLGQDEQQVAVAS